MGGLWGGVVMTPPDRRAWPADVASQRFLVAALPPLRPAALCWAVVPPCFGSPPLPEAFPPCSDASGELAILAARCLLIPLSRSASYCFGSFTFADFDGMDALHSGVLQRACIPRATCA